MRGVEELNVLARENIKEFSFEDLMIKRLQKYAEREYI